MFRCYGIAIVNGNARRLFSHDLPLLTPFVRFVNVKVATYAVWNGSNSIGKIISSFGTYSNAFKASKLTVKATINESDRSCFPSQTQLFDYLGNELLPMFDSSHCCTFEILSISGKESPTKFVASLLQLPSVVRMSKILVELRPIYLDSPPRAPHDRTRDGPRGSDSRALPAGGWRTLQIG